MTRRSRRRWIARLLGGLLALPTLACSCGEPQPAPQPPKRPAPVADRSLPAAIAEAYAIWQAVGAEPPLVDIVLGNPPEIPGGFRADGFCLCNSLDPGHDLIIVRYAIPTLIAHELGHAMGLHHVAQGDEIMSPIVQAWATVGPLTLGELRRVREESGAPPQ